MNVPVAVQSLLDAFGRDACLARGGGALHAHRQARLAAFAARGLPTRRDERWRYVDLAPVARRAFAPASPAEPAPTTLPALDAHRAIAVNGHVVALPRDLPPGVTLRALRDVDAASLVAWEAESPDALADLNAALAADGFLLELDAGTRLARPLLFDFQALGANAAAPQPRLFVRLGADARATVIEHHGGDAPHWVNATTRLALEARASLEFLRVQDHGMAAYHLGATLVTLAADAELALASYLLGGSIGRHAAEVALTGDGARFTARGLNLAMGRQQLDARVAVEHAASRTASRQTYRGVAGSHGRVACISRVLVGAGTRASDARQSLRSLLLSPHAEADAKPELEIRADEVAASHGATVGQLDRDALFYLLSRGIDRTTARALLVFAFADEVLAGLPAALRAHLEARLLARLPETDLIRELV